MTSKFRHVYCHCLLSCYGYVETFYKVCLSTTMICTIGKTTNYEEVSIQGLLNIALMRHVSTVLARIKSLINNMAISHVF